MPCQRRTGFIKGGMAKLLVYGATAVDGISEWKLFVHSNARPVDRYTGLAHHSGPEFGDGGSFGHGSWYFCVSSSWSRQATTHRKSQEVTGILSPKCRETP